MTEAIPTIRRALETHLKALPNLGFEIAYENVAFDPKGNPYLESRLLPADPDDAMLTSKTYIERGVYQVTLVMPPGKGPGPAETLAAQLRDHYARGITLSRDGIDVNIVGVPSQGRGYPDNGNWRTPVSINWQAQVFT